MTFRRCCSPTPRPNARTDSKKIIVQSGMLRIAKTDADLAVIIGHELGHFTLGHNTKKYENSPFGQLGGGAIDAGFMFDAIYTGWTFAKHLEKVGTRAYSVGFEGEADYVGAYFVPRAGYDISGAPDLWRALELESPASIRVATTPRLRRRASCSC